MLAWAIRLLALWACIAVVGYLAVTENWLARPGEPPAAVAATAAQPASGGKRSVGNSMTIPADASGHYLVTAHVNGTPIRFLVDTGATLIALTPKDAQAAGFERDQLDFSRPVHTANGTIKFAPVSLREIRLGALALNDIDAAVIGAPGGISLLGMNFLKQLESYEIRDGKLTIWW
ncbi:retropepsin-like aspartic protease family protein [Desertibaculum subflavum]|uniref:retropepsin-like aspartic protease family protein n=1 Tax=Desertibaculum subflavum TaxID=2268458 RepID=UPI000E671744